MTEIVERATKDLVPYARNPRKNDAVVDQMAASIREFGFKVSVAVKKGAKMAGHFPPPGRFCPGLGQRRQGQAFGALTCGLVSCPTMVAGILARSLTCAWWRRDPMLRISSFCMIRRSQIIGIVFPSCAILPWRTGRDFAVPQGPGLGVEIDPDLI